MKEVKYLVDTNVLSRITRNQRASDFMRRHCRIPSEVLHEAGGLPDHATLRELEFALTPAILERVRSVMASVPPGDHKLVDLYRNKGNADPILIATALTADDGGDQLWKTEWQIVSDDTALCEKAAHFSIKCLSSIQFARLIDV